MVSDQGETKRENNELEVEKGLVTLLGLFFSSPFPFHPILGIRLLVSDQGEAKRTMTLELEEGLVPLLGLFFSIPFLVSKREKLKEQ